MGQSGSSFVTLAELKTRITASKSNAQETELQVLEDAFVSSDIEDALTGNRSYIGNQVLSGADPTPLGTQYAFEKDLLADEEIKQLVSNPSLIQAEVNRCRDDAGEWVSSLINAYVKGKMGKAELAKDQSAGAAVTYSNRKAEHRKQLELDKSGDITQALIGHYEAAVPLFTAHYPHGKSEVEQRIKLRISILRSFIARHKSDRSGSTTKGVTGCNTTAQSILQESFKDSGNDIKHTRRLKETTNRKTGKKTIAPSHQKSENYSFWDNKMRAAKEAGAWVPAAPGMPGRPDPGDTYLLFYTSGQISHQGFCKVIEPCEDPDVEIWHCFDGGQKIGVAGKGMVDGSLNNIKRLYIKSTNSILQPTAKLLEEVRAGKTMTAADKKKVMKSSNQDSGERVLGGWVDVEKLISFEMKQGASQGTQNSAA